ncbi:MAG: amidohydrolase [Oscillospiraceae bacterium]|jgi:5-methylthioadenosine/S-adenosylhomocysteine deaminase|nr:amidohydrolase [Oscillospiraceae bacterium]
MLFSDILYLAPDFELKRGSVRVESGKIAEISVERIVESHGEVINGTNRLLIPGLVNSHCHVPMTLLRGWGEGLPLDRWLEEKVYPFEAKLTDDDVYRGSLIGIAEMLASGVTRFYEMYDHCGAICDAVELAGIRGNITRGLLSFDSSGLKGSQRLKESEEVFNRKSELVTPEVALHSEYTSNETYVREVAEYAKSRGAKIQVHVSETLKEHNECVARRGVTPTEYLANCGLFDVPATAAHCVSVTDRDIDILKAHNVTVAHCPESNLKLNSGIAPVRKLLDAGVSVALGTDGASSNNNQNLFEEMHVAALLGQMNSENPLSPAEILKTAVRGNSITVGADADLAVINLQKPHLVPAHDLLANLVFSAQASDVEMTIVNGKIVYRDGSVTGFDINDAIEKASAAAARLAGELK